MHRLGPEAARANVVHVRHAPGPCLRPTFGWRVNVRNADLAPAMIGALAAATLLATPSMALAQPAAPPAADLPAADDVVALQADRVVNDDNTGILTAEGAVEARYQGRTLRAAKLTYDRNTRRIRASGGVQITDPDGMVRSAEEMDLDETLNEGVATRFGAVFPGGGTAAATGAIRRADGANELREAVYTACPICKDKDGPGPTWTLSSRRAVQNPQSQMIEYRDVVLQFGAVPVLYLPYFAHPDPSAGPRSGFLPPDIGQNRRLGAFYEQPHYWRIAGDQDMTLSPRIHSQINPLLGFEYRKRFWSGEMQIAGSLTHERDFDGEGRKFGDNTIRGHVFADGRFKLNDFWDYGFGIERAADDLYLRRYSIAGAGLSRGPFVGDQFRLLSQLYALGQSETSYVNVSLIAFQGLREFDNSATLPAILPFIDAEHVMRDPLFDGQLKLKASTASLVRGDAGVDSARASIGADWSREDILGPGFVLGTFAQARGDAYRTKDGATGVTNDVTRTLGLAGVELRYPFVRRDPGVTTIIEPIMMAAVSSGEATEPGIFNEDSLAFELDDSNLFRPNAAPNYDLWEPGSRVSVGLRGTLRTDDGASATVMVGQRFRSETTPQFSSATNLADERSDYVASVSVDLNQALGARIRLRVDEDTLEVNRIDAAVRATVGALSGDLRYFKIEESLRPGAPNNEVRANLGYAITPNWSVGVGLQRDLDSNINLNQTLRLTYQDDCTLLEFSYARTETQDRRLGPNDGFQIRLGLSTLGMFGGN